MTRTIHFNDGRLNRGRHPRLLLCKEGRLSLFAGVSIPGLCAAHAERYEKNGKWSNTEWAIDVGPETAVWHAVPDFNTGRVFAAAGIEAAHANLCKDLQDDNHAVVLPDLENFRRFLGAEYPQTLARFEEYATAQASL